MFGWRDKWEKYSIAADSSEDIEVARVDEVENDGVYGTFALLKTVGDSVISLLRRRQRTHHWFAPKRDLRHYAHDGTHRSAKRLYMYVIVRHLAVPLVQIS